MNKLLGVLLLCGIFGISCTIQDPILWKSNKYSYFQSADVELNLFVFDSDKKDLSPAIIMIHGGYWKYGSPKEFAMYAQHFASIGFTSICIEYRIQSQFNSHPSDMIQDASNAYQWVINNSDQLNINPAKVYLMGGSAGGHLAYWVLKNNIQEKHKPAGLIMFNPVVDVPELPESKGIFGNQINSLSPDQNFFQTDVPILIVFSENDELISRSSIFSFYNSMKSLGNNINLSTVPNANHSSYTWSYNENEPLNVSITEEWFLTLDIF